ncbi:hypothetical protein SK128_005488 [Halocaridina rubra]|uniref:Alkylglycerol monooxygenase n=1 Tax=Halocaridina rubra TaxID=373956 RepID=A0AAN8XHF3_HALRR
MSVVLKRVGTFFYLVDPSTSKFQDEKDVPNYINEGIPVFLSMLVLEYIFSYLRGRNKARLGDAATSSGHGLVYETSKVVTRGAELVAYNWLFEYRFFDLDWSSPFTWIIAALGVDLGFYWYHRATHEVSLFWAAHQVHHSSEDFNLSTALRQSIFQRAITVFFYNPLALLGVPLPAVFVHIQLNLLFQFWIHTECVKKLGPLEWIFNTPSHHRVHHGANKYCLDKNYAGVLIIWDRMFGTFQEEKDDEEIVYGVVDQPQSFNVLWLQVYYYGVVFRKAISMETWGDSLKAIFYGPGWFPGSPRLGDMEAVPDVKGQRVKYDPQLPFWHEIYISLHFFLALAFQQILVSKIATFTWYTAIIYMVFILVSISMIGAMYDGRWWAPLAEAVRCTGYVFYARQSSVFGNSTVDFLFVLYFGFSAIIWASQSLTTLKATVKRKKLE